jgi:hypothetical protein
MSDLTRAPSLSLLERTRDLATMSEDELKRLAAEAARDRDAQALWALLEAHLTLHGSAGSRVSRHTLEAYRRGLNRTGADDPLGGFRSVPGRGHDQGPYNRVLFNPVCHTSLSVGDYIVDETGSGFAVTPVGFAGAKPDNLESRTELA